MPSPFLTSLLLSTRSSSLKKLKFSDVNYHIIQLYVNKDLLLWENNLLIEDFSGTKLLFTDGEVACGGKYPPLVYRICLCHIAIMNISYLKPGSFLISFSIPLVVSASSSALDALNPFLAKLIAGWTRRFHVNRPCRFQASNWPRTSPGTAMHRPPKMKAC